MIDIRSNVKQNNSKVVTLNSVGAMKILASLVTTISILFLTTSALAEPGFVDSLKSDLKVKVKNKELDPDHCFLFTDFPFEPTLPSLTEEFALTISKKLGEAEMICDGSKPSSNDLLYKISVAEIIN